MRPVPAVIVGGVILGLVLAWSGCGEEGTTEAPKATAQASSKPRQAAGTRASARRCQAQLAGFLDVLDALRNQLAVGLDYDGYSGLVRDARAVYDEVPADRLALACLGAVGTPAERALNEYIAGVNLWGDCLASASCEVESVEPRLQRHWDAASDLISTATGGLRDLAPRRGG
jgi:hypothetical protein